MDSAYGRSLVANNNTKNDLFVTHEGLVRYTITDRQLRTDRLDSIATRHQDRFLSPRPNAYMNQIRLEPRNVIFQSVLDKNARATTRNAFQDGWRVPIVH